jgi:mono/diheme cytochrome c family protein
MDKASLAISLTIALFLSNSAMGEEAVSVAKVVDAYCASCHDADTAKGKLDLTAVVGDDVGRHVEIWEKVVHRLRTRQMPPMAKDRPVDAVYNSTVAQLEGALDRAAAGHPNPGRTDSIRRLTRTEYQNAVRDLLAVDIDATALLPADEASHGFDNVTVGNLSPTLLDRYVTAAEKISRTAVGGKTHAPGGDTIRVKPDITQEDRVDGLPIGTRGGTLIHYTFPRDGEYEVQVRLTRDRNEHVEGLREPAELELLLDREQVSSFTVKPVRGEDHSKIDAHLKARVKVKAGPHDLAVTFLKMPSSLVETLRQPYNAHFNFHRHPRLTPAVYQVSITGPFEDGGAGDTPSRRKIFATYPKAAADEETCARQTLAAVMRHAYRRPVGAGDLDRVLPFYQDGRKGGDFDAGIESALSAILVSPEFLFRVEEDPSGVSSRTPYRISDLELASRLSFFLWSSIPDETLLALAGRGELHEPAVLAEQTRRMLADPRSQALVSSFADQWLQLRNLDSITPDGRLFPDFDDNLRQAMRRETEMHFEEVMREDRSVMELIKSDHTFLNERLAKHYGIPNVYGTRFRRIELGADTQRGGLLRQASILTVTSYATRTSPVLRGKWILENMLGIVPPPPPPNVPALKEDSISESLPVRQRLSLHRANASCANCHKLIDPPGFALENFDAIGRWRTLEQGVPVDASAGLPDGSAFDGVDGLEAALLRHPEEFTGTLAEKLLTYSLGRGVEYYDGPAIRQIVRDAKDSNYRCSALIGAVVKSVPFQMRMSP